MDKIEFKKYFQNGLKPILLFYIIAVVCRIISVYVVPEFFEDTPQSVWLQLCIGLGPTLGALAVMAFFGRKLYCSVLGTSWIRSVACVVLPVLLFLVFDGENGRKASLVFLGCVSYAFLEEVGWRGYLIGEFTALSQYKRVLIVATFWFFWHVNIPLNINALVFFTILLLASWGLDQLAHDTHSLILCACLHGIFNLFKHGNGLLDNALTLSLFVAAVVLWFLIWYFPISIITWHRQ